ncbi:hypothetical protein TIFTF001_016323 [Ficus carica]|uniref:Calcium-dependent protein kinase n=1 Tax=Ficus carica TaxID=3494 RepID=A0AA88AJD8_FICCA|nr:hypothetical protein TIFTF001_016323 [Ficus carica]
MKNNRYGKEIDIWAAGAILYRLLTRRNLEREATDDQNDLDDWINKELSGKSDAAKDLLKKMLKLDPKQRIAAAEALEHPWLKFVSETVPDFKQFVKLRTFSLTFSSMVEVLAKSLPEKENQRLKQLLNNMDTYASTMTLEELKLGLSPLSSTLSESQMKELNDAVDYFFTFPGVTKIMHRHQLEHANIHKAFQFFDTDGDGFITRDDLGQAMSPYRIGGEAAINEIIDDVDTNKISAVLVL